MPVSQLNYNSLTTGVINFLRANSSTVDSGMYASVTTIRDFRPDEYSVWGTQYPAISIDLLNYSENRFELGQGLNSRREIVCTWNIGCHIRTINSYTAVRQAMRTFVSNIEYAIRQDDTLSQTVNNAQIISVEFGNIIKGNGNWQKNGLIVMETMNWI